MIGENKGGGQNRRGEDSRGSDMIGEAVSPITRTLSCQSSVYAANNSTSKSKVSESA